MMMCSRTQTPFRAIRMPRCSRIMSSSPPLSNKSYHHNTRTIMIGKYERNWSRNLTPETLQCFRESYKSSFRDRQREHRAFSSHVGGGACANVSGGVGVGGGRFPILSAHHRQEEEGEEEKHQEEEEEMVIARRIRRRILHRKRKALAMAAAAAAQTRNNNNSNMLYARQLSSSATTTSDKDKYSSSTSSREKQASTTTSTTDASSAERKRGPKILLDKPMDADFEKYLTGDPPKPRPASMRKKQRTILDPQSQELYSNIRRKQSLQREKSRLQTAKNVYRALIGNVVICFAKMGAWLSSGSSGMLAEFIHSVVDCGNQALLLVGLRDSRLSADRKHPYGYGKSIYFWALVSALGTFFLGCGVSMTHSIGDIMHPSLHEITWHVWAVLSFSLAVDGYVLRQTILETMETCPKGVTYWKHFANLRDPATLAILLEDSAACLGVVLAMSGIAATQATGNPIFDGVAGVGISALLGAMGIALVRMNQRFLLGQAVDKDITDDIARILLARRSIEDIGSVQSQWTGPETFSYKAEVSFDGTFAAAKLMKYYQQEFLAIRDTMDSELQVLLALYAEDVMRMIEREVKHVESLIRSKYPGAEFIELEPMSLDAHRLAIDDNLEEELRRIEGEALDRFLATIRVQEQQRLGADQAGASDGDANTPPKESATGDDVGSKPLPK